MIDFKTKIKHLGQSFTNYIEDRFSSKKKTLKFIALIVFTILFLIEISIILVNNSFYNNFSDDILQYYTIMVDFIASIKEGTISWFNLNNYFGASFFSDIYYIPLDIFTFITFLLSYIMPTELAYSVTELVKIFSGVMVFAFYLSLKNYKTRTIFWMSIVYFISGGSVSFMAFPVFLSLVFYLPLSLLVIHYFIKGKKWIVPIFVFLIILYDFYLGYTILVFICFAFLIEYFKREDFKFWKLIVDGIVFVSLILLGVLIAATVLYPSMRYILDETYRSSGSFNAWVLNIGSHELNLFQPAIYFRYLAKIFVEQKPIGFYGFENNYGLEHISLYITIIGFAYMCNIFFMKDKISLIYKITILTSLVFMFFPLFSYVFSGTFDVPYTRWINMLPLIEVMILAHVFEKYGFEKVRLRNMIIIISSLLAIGGFLIYYYIKKLNIDTHYAARDVMTADTILMGVALFFLIVVLILLIFKKYKFIKVLFWLEFMVAIVYIYSGPFSIRNKLDTFNSMQSINTFLEESLKDDTQFYRVYVDVNRLDAEDINFNRMTTYATNTSIFHSWTDSETNEIGHLLFNSWEYQSKSKMDFYGYYLNQFLGYKYILVNADSNYAFDSDYFKLEYANKDYKLYEINGASSFRVYNDYITYNKFESFRSQNSFVATQKILLMAALIDSERYDVSNYNLNNINPVINDNSGVLSAYDSITFDDVVTAPGIQNTTERDFYVFNQDTLDIDFSVGAIYMKPINTQISDFGEVYVITENGTKQACQIQDGTESQIKCEFWQKPVELYIEKTADIYSNFILQLRSERAIDSSAYLVYNLKPIQFDSTKGSIQFTTNPNYKFERVFVEDSSGSDYECLDGFLSYDSITPDKLYIFKTSEMYKNTNLFNISLKYTADDFSDTDSIVKNDNISDQSLTIKNGRIHVSFTNITASTNKQIIMIPVAYSDDWVATNDINYDTISVSGGFLGIIVPAGTTNVDISLKFVPTGLNVGLAGSVAGIIIYLIIFLPGFIKKKKIKTEMNIDETS